MKDTDYAYAVAKIRANETRLLNQSTLEQMITAKDYRSALAVLSDKGFEPDADGSFEQALKNRADETWQLLTDIMPDPHELDFLLARNDFHNLKAILKGFFSDTDSSPYYIFPSTIDPEKVKTLVREKKFSSLPAFFEIPAADAYETLSRTLDGQLADILLDRAAISETLKRADETQSEFLKSVSVAISATADIKIALRCALTGKDERFITEAIAPCPTLYERELIKAAARGVDEICSYLKNTDYAPAAEKIKISGAALEKWCDDYILSKVEDAKFISFGIQPLAAYYIAREAEIKSVRIILSCKKAGLDSKTIEERMRKLYV